MEQCQHDHHYRYLRHERRAAVEIVTINRPEKRNAINDALLDEIFHYFSTPPGGVKAIVLTGSGEHFCSGLDLSEHKERSPADVVANSRQWHRAFDAIQFGVVPVVACLKGGAIGGGLELAAATHVRVAEDGSFFTLPEGQRGIFVGGGGAARIPRIIGTGRMVEMMLTGRRVLLQEAHMTGLVHHVVGKDEGLVRSLELAQAIAANAPAVNQAIVQGLSRIGDMSLQEGLFVESLIAALVKSSDDGSAIEAFLSRQKR